MSDGKNPFILIARITVKNGMVEEYLKIADEADRAVQASEPGMIFHNFDSDPSNPHKFVWSEVYRQSSDFLFHANNPPVQEYVKKHSELASYFAIEVYGNISDDVVKKIKSMEMPFTHFKTTCVGYVKEQFF